MIESSRHIIYFGNDPTCIKMLMEITDGAAVIIENNQDFKNKNYLKELRGNHIAIIDGDCISFSVTPELLTCIDQELKVVGKIFSSQDILISQLSTLFNEFEIQWYLPKPWQGQTLAKALAGTEEKVIKRMRPIPKPMTAVDPLTGLPNYSSFRMELALEFERLQNSALPLSLIRINLDGLDVINKSLGFQKADQYIREITLSIRKFLPRQYFLARYNGDNLALIAKGLNFQFAERLAEDIRKHVIKLGHPLSLSLGVGTYPTHCRTLEELISATEYALQTAKRRGKNQTVVVTLS